MARIRTIKPELLEDARTAGLSDAGFRLFVAAILLADDHGNLRADERWLEGQVWWVGVGRGDSPKSAASLRELSEVGLVTIYGVRGQWYASIRNWRKHQRIDNAGKPRVPQPSDADEEYSPNFAAKRRETPLDLRPPTSDQDPEGDFIGAQDKPAAQTKLDQLKATVDASATRAKKHRGSQIPDDWQPRAEERAWASENGLNCDDEAAQFRDHHTARGTAFRDWSAAFRTWLRNASKWKPKQPASRQPHLGVVSDALLRMANGES
jgi:hypothetical protein